MKNGVPQAEKLAATIEACLGALPIGWNALALEQFILGIFPCLSKARDTNAFERL
jgi:hypothetical protein